MELYNDSRQVDVSGRGGCAVLYWGQAPPDPAQYSAATSTRGLYSQSYLLS